MREILIARVKGKEIVIPKLLGLLMLIMSAFFFAASTADIIVTWDKIKDVKACLNAATETTYYVCELKALSAGIYPFYPLTDSDMYVSLGMDKLRLMSEKIGVWFFWITMIAVSLIIYRTGRLVTVQETEREEEVESEE